MTQAAIIWWANRTIIYCPVFPQASLYRQLRLQPQLVVNQGALTQYVCVPSWPTHTLIFVFPPWHPSHSKLKAILNRNEVIALSMT